MKEYDRVELIVEKERYVKHSVHKGMDGWICDPRNIEESWLVCFDNNDLDEFPIISVLEEDLIVVEESE
jgi:hypothetical protein